MSPGNPCDARQRVPDSYEAKTREVARPIPNPGPLPSPWQATAERWGTTYATRELDCILEVAGGLMGVTCDDTPESVTRLLALLEWRRRGGQAPGDGSSSLERPFDSAGCADGGAR